MNLVKKNLKFLTVALIISAAFTVGLNKLESGLEDYFFVQEFNSAPFTAHLIDYELQEPQSFQVDISAKTAMSVWTNLKGERKILFQKQPLQPRPIASLTKLMTALVISDLKETYNYDQLITITKEAIEQNGAGNLKPGGRMSVKDLLAMSLIESSNDASFTLAEPIGKKGFVGLMNIYAEKLHLKETEFYSSTGLETENGSLNYSTAQDLIKLSEYILKEHPQIFEISSHQTYRVLNPDGTLHHYIEENTNQLVGEIPNLMGGKTGYTDEAQQCLITVIKNNNGYFINVILGSNDRFGEMKKIINHIQR